MRVSVILHPLGPPDLRSRCLARLLFQSYPAPKIEILLPTLAETSPFPDPVRVIAVENPKEGWNRAARLATGDLLLFLGPDTVPAAGCVEAHAEAHEPPASGIAQGALFPLPYSGPIATACWKYLSSVPLLPSNFSVARSAWLETGGFDPLFFDSGWEALDLYLTLREQAPLSLRHDKRAIVHAAFGDSWRSLAGREFQKGALLPALLAKHGAEQHRGDPLFAFVEQLWHEAKEFKPWPAAEVAARCQRLEGSLDAHAEGEDTFGEMLRYSLVKGAHAAWSRQAMAKADPVAPMLQAGGLANKKRDHKEAERWFKTVLEWRPNHPLAAAGLAWAYLGQYRFREGEAILDEALKAHPEEPRLHALKGWLHKSLFNLPAAEKAFLLALDSQSPSSSFPYVGLGYTYIIWGKFEKAEEILATGVKQFPDNPLLYGAMARLRKTLGNGREAHRLLDLALSLQPDSLPLQYLRGEIACEEGGTDSAERIVRAVLERNPEYVPAHWILGVIAMKRGDHKMAEQHLGNAINRHPKYLPAYKTFGTIYRATGRIKKALKMYQVVLDTLPADAPLVKKTRELLAAASSSS